MKFVFLCTKVVTMKITIVCHSDSLGGAAIVSRRLLCALLDLGADARMLVINGGSGHPKVTALGRTARFKAAFLAEHADIFLRNGLRRAQVFAVSTAKWGLPLASHPLIADADAVVLTWVNQGMVSLEEIARIKAPVAWIMHDMWNLTGICHHAGACRRYESKCGDCPLLGPMAGPHDLSHSVWLRKEKLYAKKRIRFVAISSWLAQKCRQASLMRGQDISVIPNPFPLADFSTVPARSRKELGLPEKGRLIAMGAARLDDPIKGLPVAIEALNTLTGTDAVAVFFGTLRNPKALDRLNLPYVHLGPVDSVADIFAHSHIALSASSYESLPSTLIEGIASGCLAVTFGQGGQPDIVNHLSNGYIAADMSAAALARGLQWALQQDPDRQELHQSMQRFAPEAVARAVLSLFQGRD